MSTDIKLSEAQISKIILTPLGVTGAASAIDAGILKKIHDSGTTILIISNEENNDIIKIVQVFKYSNILLEGVTGGFLSMLLGTLGAYLLGNLLLGKGVVRV